MRNLRGILLFFSLVLFFNAVAREQGSGIVFKNGDRVCFIGNSITANGQFCNFISLYYAARFPNENIRFFNCGISGNSAAGVIRRMEYDILVHKPTWSVVMLGMNDVNRGLYAPNSDTTRGIKEKRQAALDNYKEKLEFIIRTLLKHNSKVILQKPTIYDQTGALKSVNHVGVNDALGMCCKYIDELATKYGLPVVDYWTILNKVNQAIQKDDPTATIIGPDRIHPRVPGHFVMAYQFLRSALMPGPVSRIEVDAHSLKIADHCEVKDFRRRKNGFLFLCRQNSIPFPVKDEAMPALAYVPFTDEYDQQLLRVRGAKKGNYDLLIDHASVGRFTSGELAEGINLALLKQAPQYQQSEDLLSLFEQYLEAERDIRSLRLVEFDFLRDEAPSGMDSIKIFLDHLLVSRYAQSQYREYYKSQFDHYIEVKSKEESLQDTMDKTYEKFYEKKPAFHLFEIVKVK